jgi:hypothetical protein
MLAALLAGSLILLGVDGGSVVDVRVTGTEETVFDWSQNACEGADIPDAPARAFRDASGRVQLISSHYVNRRMIGPDLNHLTRDCHVIMRSTLNPDPAKFDDREWIHSPYTPDGTKVYALVHDEYQGQTHPGRCPSGEYFPCWYNAVTSAVSTDGGNTFGQATPPDNLVAAIPYPYAPDSGPAGLFQSSNIVHNGADGYYYALVRAQRYRAQQQGTCVMRTRDLSDPKSWRAWNGEAFAVRFIDPYLQPDEPPKEHVCHPVSFDEIQLMVESLTFNTYLNRYLLVGTAAGSTPEGNATSGIYYSTSENLVDWTPRKLILQAESRHTYACGDADPVAYPSLLDPESTSRNFETTGDRAYLYYTRFNYASCKETPDRDLVRVPIKFSK